MGVFANCYAKREVPRIIVKDSEGRTDEGLIKVFDKILVAMRTPTYHTLNYTHPKAVELAESLCLRDSITGGDHADRDASYVLWELVGERPIVYWDQGRDLPQYSGEILEKLNMQFGNVRIGLALRRHEEFSRILPINHKFYTMEYLFHLVHSYQQKPADGLSQLLPIHLSYPGFLLAMHIPSFLRNHSTVFPHLLKNLTLVIYPF